jgi:hypothetical protein
MLKRLIPAFFILLIVAITAAAQEVEVDRYNITARIDTAASAADLRAAITVSNLSQSPKPKLFLRLTKLAKVGSVTVNGSPAQFETADDRRVSTLNQIIITPSSPIAAGASCALEVSYRIEAPESSALIHIYPGEVLLGPDAIWVPMPSTVFTLYGPTTAPCSVTVSFASGSSNMRAASSGALKSDASGPPVTFDQTMNSLPLIVAGSFDQPLFSEHGGVKIEVYIQPGITTLSADGKPPASSIASRLSDEAGRIIDYLTKTLGPPPAGATFRIISSARAGNLVVPGALVLSEQVFRRDSLSAGVVEALADAVARMWIDGRVRLRGQEPRSAQENRQVVKARSAALFRDSLPRYLGVLYFEDRFGRDAARAMLSRMRGAYTPVAQSGRDAELGIQTNALPNYAAAVFSKGPLVLRLLAETMGREKFVAIIKSISGAQTRIVTSEELRTALVKAGGPDVEKIFQQWIDSIIEPDLIIGAPLASEKSDSQRANVRNLGTGDVTVSLVAVTVSGKRVTTSVTVPSENIASAEIPTSEKITSIEVDPEKLIVQTNYDNDARDIGANALRTSAQTLFNESIAAFNKGQYQESETKLREAIVREPDNPLLHAWLARTLIALKKMDEAAREANAAIKVDPPVGSALGWAHISLGQVALARNQAAEAARFLRLAVAEAEEAPAQFAARESLIQAERATNITPQVEEPVRALIANLDAAIKQPSDKLSALVVRNNLKKFVQGLTLRPTVWTTEILHAEQVDANRVALDVGLKVKAEGRDQSGTAVFVLCRTGGGWLLEDVQLFNVK